MEKCGVSCNIISKNLATVSTTKTMAPKRKKKSTAAAATGNKGKTNANPIVPESKDPNKEKSGWEKSHAKASLYGDLVAGRVPLEAPSDEDEEDLEIIYMQ